jgi:septal ring factor EnvC (AmiA/AmiB activator)
MLTQEIIIFCTKENKCDFRFLSDAQKNLEMEKKKCDKAKETLAKTEEELKDLRKVRKLHQNVLIYYQFLVCIPSLDNQGIRQPCRSCYRYI